MVMFEEKCPVCNRLFYAENRPGWAYKIGHKYYCSYKCFRTDAEQEKQRQREQRQAREARQKAYQKQKQAEYRQRRKEAGK